MEDKLQLFYNSLSANPNIKGIPDDYDVFRSTLADPEKSELFYNSLSANPKIKGLPEDYDAFVSGLNLNTGGVTPKEEQQQQRQGYFEGLGNKLQAGVLSLGEMVTEIPQFAEGISNAPYMAFSNMMVNMAEKKGEIDKETAETLKKEQLLPKSSFAQGLPRMPGEQTVGEALANSKLNQFFEDNAEQLSEAATRYDRTATEYIKDKQFGKALGVVSYGIAESLAPTLAAAFCPYGAAFLGLGVGAQSYDEVKDREDMSEMMKLADAVTSGIFEWVFERFGTREMAQFLKGYYKQAGKKGIEQAIKSQGLQNLFARAYKKFGLWFAHLHEGLSEMLTEFGQNWAAKFSGEDPNRKITDNAIESFLVGTGMGGVFTSTAALAKKLKGQEDETGTPGEPIDQGPPGIGELKVPYTEEQATEAINEIGKDLKFGDTPLEEDPNPIISFAETKLGQKVILKKEGGVNGDTFFIAFDLETNEPILVKPRDILERKDVPYQEWVKNELNNYNIVKTQGGKMVAQAEAPVQEGQEITLKDKNFYVSEVTPEGIALNEIDEEGNVTGATVHITPDQYGPVFGIEEQPGEAPTIKEGATGQPVTEDAQTAPQEELQIPLNKQGEIDYDNIQDPQTYAQALIQEFAEGAPTVLDELITEKQDALAKAGKVSNAIERARKIKSLNSDVNKLTDVRNILSPTATTITIASPAVEQAEPIEQATAQDMARPKEEQPVVEQTTAQTPSTPDETAPVEAEMQEAGEVEKKTSADLTKANAEVDTNPTEAEKEAGNYKKGHLSVQGLDISIENPAMSVRSGTDKAGKKWSVMLNNSYGYFRRTKGKDGDQVDVFLGDNLDSDAVYVIDQVNPETGLFDEHKVMMGFISAQDAKDNYLANYEPGWKGLGAISKMSIDQFKDWLGSGTRTKKPVDGNVPVKKKAEPKTKAEKPSKSVKEVTLKPRKKGLTYGPNSRTGKVLSKTPNSFQEAVLQFFIGGGRIKTQDFLDHTGYKRGSREFRQYIWAIKNDGVRLDVFNEALDNSFGIENQGPMDMINEVIDILRTYPGRGHMITALEKLQDVETIPDHMLPPEEDPSLEYDDLQGADEETEELTDDIMDHPEVKEIIKEYSFDGVLDVSKLLDKIDTDPNEFTIFPFALKKSELLKLKERLQDEQRRRTQESQTGTGQHNKDQSQGARENTTRSDQGNAVRTGPVEKGPAEKPEVNRKSSQKSKSEFAGEVLEKKSPKGKAEYGSKNKVFTADAAQKARELLKKKLGNLNVGIDPEVMQAGITLAGYHIEAGARKFADYAKEMINDMGEAIKPYLKSFYNAVRDWPGFDTEGMDDYAAVSTIDVSNLVAENLDNTKEVSNLHKNIQDVPNRSGDSQPNSQNNSDEVSGDEETVPNEGGSSRPVGDESSQQNRETRGGRSSQGGSGLFAPLFGEPSNNKVSQEDQSPELTDDDAGDFDGRGNDLFGPAGHDSSVSNTGEKGSNISKGVSTSFQERTRLRKIAQQKAEPIPVKIADKGNIEETLPVLLPEQQEDVLKAENRFFNEAHQTHELAYGKGMLFTNGTGTGKTYTGLGIIKRFLKQGKRDILIVVPSEAKKKDWIKDGGNLLLSITELKDTKDKGNGVRVTTYATFRANENLKNVDFDLVVYDECHRLMEDKGGNPSATTEAHYQMSNVSPNSAFTRITSAHPLWIRRAALNREIRIESKSTNNLDLMDWQLAEIRDKIKALEEELKTVEEEIRQVEPSIKERAEKAHDKTKVLMLSATPFKGHFNLRYANKVLFDWGDETTYEQASRGMSRVDPEGRFFLDNFGAAYEWKYHRLQTKSNANAEAIAMQEVEFAEKLMKQGVLSGRAIESDMDYSREFPLVALDKAEIFNQGFTDIFTYGEAALFPNLTEPASEVFFNYNYTTQLLESLRASMSIPRIEKHLTLGRKVVVFHRRKQANASPPFANILQVARSNANTVLNSDTAREEEKAKAKVTLVQADLFEEKYRELLEYEQTLNYSSAIDQIIQKFGAERVGLVNGDVSKKDKMNNIRRFNEDDSGVDIIVVQEEAGKEGISLHDTTGKHPRVMMSLSLPISSTTALQMEGRIFRIGQASNAIFENPILGLDMEIADFGQKINRKLSTTENLAVGNQARDLIRSFSEGVLFNAKKDDPHIDQGKGGKEYDKKAQQQLSEFRRAVLVYSTNQKNRGRRDSREGIDYFATPEPLGQKMVEWLDLKPGNSAMEPSAGHGAIAMWFPESINTTSIEPSYSLYAKLNARAGGGNRKIIRSNFEDFNIVNKFDGIAMNPPFGTQGKMAMDHIEKAFKHLRNRGRIVAIIPDSPSMQKRFDSFINGTNEDGKPLNPDAHLVESIKLPRVTFEQAGTQVAARVVVIDKIEIKTKAQIHNELAAEDLQRVISQRGASLRPKEMLSAEALRRYEEQFEQIPHTINRELPEVKTVDEFFDRIEDISVPARPEAPESANSISTDSPTATEPAQEGDVAKLIIQKHSKTGAELPTVQLLNRVSSDVYNKYKSIASSFGGRWSSYKREGMIPGFIFRNGEDAKNALTQINNTKNDVSSLHDKAEKYIKKNKVYSQARPKTDFPEEVSFVSEGSLGNIPGQHNLFGEEVYSPTPPDDNVTYVERLLSDKGQIEFIGDKITGPSEIRSSADIAFLFKNLESAASENVFFVFIDKNNKYKVLYMSTGTTNMAPVDSKIVVAAAKEFKAERAVFVHNHPSGSLKASDSDIKTYSRTRDLLEKIGVTLDPSVIINLDSGEYAVFDTSSFSVVPSDKMYYDLYETVTPQSIYQFDRQKLYAPLSDHHAIRQSSDVAEYLSRMKRGTTPKIHAIILDRNLKITRYALYDETITREKLIEELLYEVGKHGENIILASNSDPAPELLSSISNAMKLANGQLLDYVVIKQSDDITRNYNSYADLGYLSEPDIEYGGGPDAKFRISDDLYFSPVERALDAIKQDKATVEQFKAMLLKNGAKQAELDWMGWDEFANDKRVITKAKIQDWIDQNKIRVEEVQKGGFQWKGNDLIVGGKVVANLIHNEDGTWSYQSDFSEGEEAWETKLDAQKEAEEAIIGDAYSPNATKYSQYTLPGGENYKELLLTMPDKSPKLFTTKVIGNKWFVIDSDGKIASEPLTAKFEAEEIAKRRTEIESGKKINTFKSSHFDEPNILAHVRFNTRRTQDGKNILFIEEIQSDWAQKGKKEGFKGDMAKQLIDPTKGEMVKTGWGYRLMLGNVQLSDITNYEIEGGGLSTPEEIKAELIRKGKGYNESTLQGSVPDMPYKKTDQWAGLALRRMVRYAIDNGFDAIAWTPGEVQNERYDLSKQVDKITYTINEKTRKTEYPFKLRVWPKNGGSPIVREINNVNELEDFVGKEIAEKIDSSGGEYEGGNREYKILSNLDLKVGGSGMTGFYDNILPSIANKLGKKFGSHVEETKVVNKRFNIRLKNNGFYEINDIDGHMVINNVDPEKIDQWKESSYTVHSLPITDAMFDSYRQGIPLFRRNQYQGQSLLFDVVGINTSQNLEKEIRDKVKDLEESLNTKITIIQNRGQLPERIQRQAIRQGIATNKRITGVYDPQTESVYVLLDDVKAVGIIKGIEEVIKTVLHEVVAHKGLPSLLGQDEYNRLLDSVYWDMPQIDRSFLMEQYNTTDPHTIAEEYLAMMAEQNVSPTLFQRILAKIRQLLRKLFKINYSENDIHDMLRRSRENLHKPQANNYTNAEEYLEAIDTYEKARFRVTKAYSKNIVDKAAEAYKENEVKRSIKETKQGIREYIQDMNLPVRKFEEEVLKRGGKQDDQSKPYRDTSLSFGRHEKLYNDFFDQKMKPVLNTVAKMKKTGIPGENILPYIIAKHAIERNRAFRTKERDEYIASNPEATPSEIKEIEEVLKDKDYSGVMPFDKEGEYTNPDELAQDIVNEFETQLNNKGLIDELWENLRTANTSILDTWVKGDQISEEQREEYLNNFKYFVPLRGWRQGAAKELIYTKGQGFSRSLRHAEGRKTLADNPLAYILSVQFQAISEQVTNEVNNSMLNLIIKNLGNNEIHELATLKKLYYLKVNLPDGSYEWEPTLTRPTAEQLASGEARTKIFREHEKLRAPSQAREHEVIVRKPGGDMVMIFKGQNLPVAQSLNKQNYLYRSIFGNVHDARDINKAMTLLGDINNVLKAAYTSWNVVFPFTNFMRDFQEASITQAIKQGSGLKVIRNYKHAFPAIIRHLTGKADLNNRIDKELEEFYQYGGATGYTHLKTPEEIEKDIKKEIKRMVRAGSLRGDMANTAVKFLGGVEAWNMIFEDATRFSVYLASIASGNTKKDAAYDAKEASVNFNRKGKGSKAWDAYFAFFNVAIQSMQKNFALAKDHTGKFAAVAGSFIAVGFLEAMMNALFDDDDDTSYYNINPYMRQNYLVIPNIISLLRDGTKGDKYLSIPLPQFWRGFKSMGAIGFDIAVKKATVKDGIMQALGNFGASLLPVDIGGFWASGEFSFAPIMPTVIKPVVEVLENTNYMGYAIKNEPFTRDQEAILANAGLGKKNVSPAAKFITDMLFRWGGGDSKYKYYYDSNKGISKKVPGILDINPSTIEHLFKGYTGGTGGVFSDMITTISQALDVEQEIDYRNMPFVNRFIRKVPESKWDIISKYYNLRDDNKVINALSSNYFKEGQYEKALEIAGDEYMAKYVAIFKHYESALNDAKKAVDFDDVEGNYVGIELMRQCVNDINDLKEEYGR